MRAAHGGASTITPAWGCWPSGSSPWSDAEPVGDDPGRAKRGRPSAGDHAAGDPPGVAAAAGAGQPARLRVLPALARPQQNQANGVALVLKPGARRRRVRLADVVGPGLES